MGQVTGPAISIFKGFMAELIFSFFLLMTSVTGLDKIIGQQSPVIGGMRLMAAEALALQIRQMHQMSLAGRNLCRLMAVIAKRPVRLLGQSRIFGGMNKMAVNTISFPHRLMDGLLLKRPLVMTLETINPLGEITQIRQFDAWQVAELTFFLLKGLVIVRVQKFPLIVAMRIMTLMTTVRPRLNIEMTCLESWRGKIMAADTDGL